MADSVTLIVEEDENRAKQFERNLSEVHHVNATRWVRSEAEALRVLQQERGAIDHVCIDSMLYEHPQALDILRQRLNKPST